MKSRSTTTPATAWTCSTTSASSASPWIDAGRRVSREHRRQRLPVVAEGQRDPAVGAHRPRRRHLRRTPHLAQGAPAAALEHAPHRQHAEFRPAHLRQRPAAPRLAADHPAHAHARPASRRAAWCASTTANGCRHAARAWCRGGTRRGVIDPATSTASNLSNRAAASAKAPTKSATTPTRNAAASCALRLAAGWATLSSDGSMTDQRRARRNRRAKCMPTSG